MSIISNNVEATQAVARSFSEALQPGDVLLLVGDLGAGKTHFTQGLAQGLGIAESPTSPTFNLMCSYEDGRIPLYHFDLYRLDDAEQLEDIDYFGIIEGDGVSVVEWGDKFAEAQPDECLTIVFRVLPDGTRTLDAVPAGQRGQQLAQALEAAAL